MSICLMGLSRVRKLLREGNCDAIFNPLKDEPGRPEWKLAPRQGTRVGHQSHMACVKPYMPTGWEMLHHYMCSLSLFMSESQVRGKLT